MIDEITETRGRGNKECVAQGIANIVTGFFSGMGGCAMIGQSLINISSVARARLSGIVASVMLLVFIMFGAGLIERLPMAALTGLMIMVAIGTFEWASLKSFGRMPKADVLVIVLVALVTVLLHKLALAVLIGVIIAALLFAWENAKRIRARKYVDEKGVRHYEMFGPLFFGSVTAFNEKFDVLNDPNEVIIDFAESRVMDMSGIEALNKITERYHKAGKKLHLKHLSPDCRQLLKNADTNAETGLSSAETENRLKEFGPNSYQRQKQKSIWRMILQQFRSPIVYLLLAGAGVSLYFQDYIEAIAIMGVILINALIGFFMELQARNSMNALREMDVIRSKVIRDGKVQEIPSEKLTPGDVVSLEAGDIVPADGRLIELNKLQCDESSLTGESLPTEKNTEKLDRETTLGDRHNMVFKGTSVMNGNARFVITGIGLHTELGTITSLVADAKDTTTPLDKKLTALGKRLIWLTLILTLLFALTGVIEGKEWVVIIKTSIALAVAAFPEGLPIVSTVALAYGMLLMAKRNAIVKKLSAVETLGSTTVILTDKTGTLTENKIFVNTLSFPEESRKVSIEDNALRFTEGEIEMSKENFEKLKLIGALCNDASLTPSDENKKTLGDPIEIALLQLANSSGTSAEELQGQHERTSEIPFNSIDKIMGTMHTYSSGNFVAAKGSVEHLLKRCVKIQSGATIKELGEAERNSILSESEKMASQGLRVLAFGYREGNELDQKFF